MAEQLLAGLDQLSQHGPFMKEGDAGRWDSWALFAKIQQQAASLVISTKKDETSQTDGCHSREDTCK